MILSGVARLGKDAEVRFTPGGDAVSNLSLAFNYGKKDDKGHRPTTWVDAALWGKRAEALAEYLTKGTAVDVVINDVRIETYEGRNGKGFSLRGNVLSIEFAGGKSDKKEGGEPDPAGPEKAPAETANPAEKGAGKFDDFEDDLPFN